jgi:hypothetical protein
MLWSLLVAFAKKALLVFGNRNLTRSQTCLVLSIKCDLSANLLLPGINIVMRWSLLWLLRFALKSLKKKYRTPQNSQ